MRRTLSLTLLALTTLAPHLAAQDCPARPAQHIRPSARGTETRIAGVYEAPWEYVCGRPLRVRVHQVGTEVSAVVQASGCPQDGQVRWRGTLHPGQAWFPVEVARPGGSLASAGTGTATRVDPCTLAIATAGRAGAARYTRVDGPCAPRDESGPRPVVAFIGGALDTWNRNLLRVFCAYDARWEGTRKLYFMHTEDSAEVRRRVTEAADGAPIVLIGHSYGANFAYELANAMAEEGGVHLLLTLDPVSGPGGPRVPLRPDAARTWINVWAGSGVGLSSCGLAGAIGGAWGSRPEADLDLRFPPDPTKDDPDDDHCKTEEMFLLPDVQGSLAGLSIRDR
jgi:pimeloyl-ACP methyl ester carboxylesterase